MKYLLIFILLIGSHSALHAQHARFPAEGTIEFEKSVNMYAVIKRDINAENESYMNKVFEQYQKTQPQFKVMKSTLLFSKQRTLYTPGEEVTASNNYSNDPAVLQPNITLTDLASKTSVTQKKVFDETFLVRDSVRKINWKITSETRDIAGYSCRRANALILDSIYVVAFYTDQIPVPGGPESFTGLPGMILGVALPHENVTWFAKLVTDKTIPPSAMAAPVKGKATDLAGLKSTINSALKSWGDYAKSALKAFML